MRSTIKIGTRGSKLAIKQTDIVMGLLMAVMPEVRFEIIPIQTLGDRILDRPLLSFGGKGAFVSEFEEALLGGKIDLAVHSAKDMPVRLPDELAIVGVPEREDPREVLITLKGQCISQNAVIGTSSLRRKYQVQQLHKVICKDLRGNIETRLKKLEQGEYQGIILAAAGLKRLGLAHERQYDYHYFHTDTFVPAGGQGIIAVEGRKEEGLSTVVSRINDKAAALSLNIERKTLELLDAGCHEPIGVFSQMIGQQMQLIILDADERKVNRLVARCPIEEADRLPEKLVSQLKKCRGAERHG